MLKHRIKDYYFHKAKSASYPARSVYKLKEADEKYRFLHQGDSVLDLGAYPGSWLKYTYEVVGPEGFILGVDRKDLKSLPGPNVYFLAADLVTLDVDTLKKIRPEFDVVLSDLAPDTSGVKTVDHLRSMDLARKAFEVAIAFLRTGGTFFVKVFQGEDLSELQRDIKTSFGEVKLFKPKSSRAESREIFILARGRK